MYEELRERNLLSKNFFGPYNVKGGKKKLLTFRDSVEDFLSKIEDYRIKETYKHHTCTGM